MGFMVCYNAFWCYDAMMLFDRFYDAMVLFERFYDAMVLML